MFYAGMELHEEVIFWLNKGTHPHIPKWKDTILLALATYYAQKADYTNSRFFDSNHEFKKSFSIRVFKRLIGLRSTSVSPLEILNGSSKPTIKK